MEGGEGGFDELESLEEQDGGIVHCAFEVATDLGEFAELFEAAAPIREAARFAMAIGIQADARFPRDQWKKGKPRNIAHLRGQFDEGGKYDYALLFEMLGLVDEGVPLNVLISEYISGGMKWIRKNELATGTNYSQMRTAFPALFSQELEVGEEAMSEGGEAEE